MWDGGVSDGEDSNWKKVEKERKRKGGRMILRGNEVEDYVERWIRKKN